MPTPIENDVDQTPLQVLVKSPAPVGSDVDQCVIQVLVKN